LNEIWQENDEGMENNPNFVPEIETNRIKQ
jgi:hypothetical protein